MAFFKLKIENKPIFPALYLKLTTPWPPSRVIYADDLFDAAQHRGDTGFLLWTIVDCLLSVSYWEINILDFIYSFKWPPRSSFFPLTFIFTLPQAYYSLFPNWMLFFIFILSSPNVQIYLNHPQTQSYNIWITFGFFFPSDLSAGLVYDWQDFHFNDFY